MPTFDPNKWFVDQDGNVRYLREFGADNIELHQRDGWVEVYQLGARDGDDGRPVDGEWVLHEGDPATVMAQW